MQVMGCAGGITAYFLILRICMLRWGLGGITNIHRFVYSCGGPGYLYYVRRLRGINIKMFKYIAHRIWPGHRRVGGYVYCRVCGLVYLKN